MKGKMTVNKAIISLYVLLGLYGVGAMVELQVWRGDGAYPLWLTKTLDVPFKVDHAHLGKSMELFDKVCGNNRGMMAITQKPNGYFMRCDDALVTPFKSLKVYHLRMPAEDEGVQHEK